MMMKFLLPAFLVALCGACNSADPPHAATDSASATAAAFATDAALAPTPVAAPEIRFEPTGQQGQFDLQNAGSALSISSRLQVEMRVADEWRPVASELYVAEACSLDPLPACRRLAPRERVRLLRYDGFTCSMQCPPGCRANAQLSPGSFRLVALSCDGTQRFVGGAFDMK